MLDEEPCLDRLPALVLKGKTKHVSDEDTYLDSELSLPHAPMHYHVKHKDDDNNIEISVKGHDTMGGGGSGLARDKYNIAVLMFLYVLQGIPLGLAGSVPYLLQSRQVNYKDPGPVQLRVLAL